MRAPSMVIDISASGVIQAMHRDLFPLGFLGKQVIVRASDIKHDTESDTWSIHVSVGNSFVPVEGAHGFPTYEAARDMEVRWFELCRLHDVTPISAEGQTILARLR